MNSATRLAFLVVACNLPVACTRGSKGEGDKLSPRPGSSVALCEGLDCEVFPDAKAAFAKALSMQPSVLALGETHAPAQARVPSTTRTFATDLLPMLQGRAKHLVIELWLGNPSCEKAVKAVVFKQQEITAHQAPTNQNDFLALGDAAKKLGIFPRALVPPCSEYQTILDAGTGDVDAMLKLVRRLSARAIEESLAPGTMVVAYGGAMHNDVTPRPGTEQWSFGPELQEKTRGGYLEVDLITPEFIGDTDTWKSLPWYAGFHRERQKGEAVLIRLQARSYVLVFPRRA